MRKRKKPVFDAGPKAGSQTKVPFSAKSDVREDSALKAQHGGSIMSVGSRYVQWGMWFSLTRPQFKSMTGVPSKDI